MLEFETLRSLWLPQQHLNALPPLDVRFFQFAPLSLGQRSLQDRDRSSNEGTGFYERMVEVGVRPKRTMWRSACSASFSFSTEIAIR